MTLSDVQQNLLLKPNMGNLNSKEYNFTYQTKNMINGKTYIGVHSTNKINDGYLGSGDKLAFSIKKYGKENFKIEILCFYDTKKEAFDEERFLVDSNWVLDRGNYNMTLGGFAPPDFTGKTVSEETKRKISLKNTGKIRSPETRKLIGDIQRGRKITNLETLAKMSASMMGKNRGPKSAEAIAKTKATKRSRVYIVSDETRKKLSEAGMGRKISESTINKRKKTRLDNFVSQNIDVYCVITGSYFGRFDSVKDIVANFDISQSSVSKVLLGQTIQHRKYIIRKAIENED